MLLSNFDLLQNDPSTWFALLIVIIAGAASAVTVHEAAHAWSALQLGDRTAAALGRVTLNPRAHLDPGGSLLFLLVFFGWGKPTPVNAANLRGDPERSMAVVSAAGPVSNLILAAILAIPFRLELIDWRAPGHNAPFTGGSAESIVADFLVYGVLFNSFLAIFNLIPLPPLDGFALALGILPRGPARIVRRVGRYGFAPLGILLVLEFATPFGVLSGVFVPLSDLVIEAITGHSLR